MKVVPCAVLLAAVSACDPPYDDASSQAAALREPTSVPSPAGPGSAEPNLFAAEDGRVLLSWLEPVADGSGEYALRLAELTGGAWSEPVTVARGDAMLVNWADFPSVIELPDGSLAAHWLARTGEGYAYEVRLARSADGGRTWSDPVVPHRDGTPTEHGFVSLFPWQGRLGAVWLDGRNYAQSGGHHGAGEAEMTLRFASVDDDGGLADEAVLDPRTCDCCQTSVALTSSGPLVAYRDRSSAEIRDVSVIRRSDAGWTEPSPVHEDGWEIAACPVNGPAADADGGRVAVAWFTAARDTSKVLVAFSADAGATFSAPVRVDGGRPAGRVDVELLEGGGALVTWLERTDSGASVLLRRVPAEGDPGDAVTVASTSAERASGFPRMAMADDRVVFAWTEPGVTPHVRVAELPLEAAP